jgi:hypothetical protein
MIARCIFRVYHVRAPGHHDDRDFESDTVKAIMPVMITEFSESESPSDSDSESDIMIKR